MDIAYNAHNPPGGESHLQPITITDFFIDLRRENPQVANLSRAVDTYKSL
jgi:hypothetical protein